METGAADGLLSLIDAASAPKAAGGKGANKRAHKPRLLQLARDSDSLIARYSEAQRRAGRVLEEQCRLDGTGKPE